MALVHGGQFPKFLSQTAFNLLIDDNAQVSVADIPDYFLQAKIQQLSEATSSNQIQEVMDENSVLFEIAGCYKPVTVFSESARNKLVDDVVRFIVIGRNLPAIHQIRQGLQTFGLFQLMTEHSSQFFEVFCYGHTVKLTADQMEAIFNRVEYSDIGSNKRRKEECTISFWRDYLYDIEEVNSGVTFEDLLVFATGANHVPYLGFSPDPSIQFIDDEVEKNLPQANTCSMMLHLPIVKNYDQFKENMDFGILNSPGFGMA